MLHIRDTDFRPTQHALHRVNGFGAACKRRYFSADEKARIVAESFASAELVCSVARRHGLMAAQLFAWRKNARLRGEVPAASAGRAPSLKLEILTAVAIDKHSATQVAPIKIAIGATIVRVPKDFDAATLRAVLQALGAAS